VIVDVTCGEVSIGAWEQPGVEVDIVATDNSAPTLEAGALESADAVTIRAKSRPDGQPICAGVTIKVPAAAAITRLDMADGTIRLAGLRGEINANLARGTVAGDRLGGMVRLETGSGDVNLTGFELSPTGGLRIRTFTGSISVSLAQQPTDARLLLLTLTGTIASNLPLSERTGFGSRFREGVIGKGAPLISLDAVRGNIEVTAPAR
jgi:hypothetical protein